MRKNGLIMLFPLIAALAACGNVNTPSKSEGGSDSKVDDTSVAEVSASVVSTSESPVVSSSENTAESSSDDEKNPSELEILYGNYEAFAKNYKALVNKEAHSLTYFNKSSSFTSMPTKVTVDIDDDEYLMTSIPTDDDGNDLNPSYRYFYLGENEYCDVDYDGSYYSSANRYKIGEPNLLANDIISATAAKAQFDEAIEYAGNSIGKIYTIQYDIYLHELRDAFQLLSYDFYEEDNGSAYIEFKAMQNMGYCGNYFTIELDLTPNGDIKTGYFKRDMYLGKGWDGDKGEKVENATPTVWYSSSVSNVIYSSIENTKLFDASRFFAESATGITYHYFQSDMESGVSTEITEMLVGETLTRSQFDFDGVRVSPSTAVDIRNVFITDSSNKDVIDAVDNQWTAKSVGTTELTLGNSFKKDIAKVTVSVVNERMIAAPSENPEK